MESGVFPSFVIMIQSLVKKVGMSSPGQPGTEDVQLACSDPFCAFAFPSTVAKRMQKIPVLLFLLSALCLYLP